MNIILFGFKGAGKTYLGQKLAHILNRPFLDTDDILEALGGKSTRALYQELGESSFRALERAAIRRLQGLEHSVIALGGGAPLDLENRVFLSHLGKLVYLDAPLDLIRKRLKHERVPFDIQQAYEVRKPLYESLSAVRVDLAHLSEASALHALIRIAHGIE